MSIKDLLNETEPVQEAPDTPVAKFTMRRGATAPESCFKIDKESRSITPPDDFENFGVESDENTERVYFECPQFVGDDIDLTDMNLYINFKNANGELDKYIIDDVVSDGSNVRFSWVLSRKCTRYKGTLTFIVCAVKTNENAEIVKEWNTTLCTGQVLEGLEVENPEVEESTTDLINQLVELVLQSKTEVDATRQMAIDEITALKDEVIEEVKNAGESVENSLYANAVKGYASGKMIDVNDVSPLPHIVKAKVHGKNLVTYPFETDTSTTNGVTFTVNDDQSITVDGTPNLNTSFPFSKACIRIEKGKTYTFSHKTVFSGSEYFYLALVKGNATVQNLSCTNDKPSVTFTANDDGFLNIGLVVYRDVVYNNAIVRIQLEEGDTATEYEPWIDPTTVELEVAQGYIFDGNFDESLGYKTPNVSGAVEFETEPNVENIHITSYNSGVTIDLEYNKDTNKAYAGVQKDIKILDDDITKIKNGYEQKSNIVNGFDEFSSLQPNTLFFMGVVDEWNTMVPTDAKKGDLIYINFTSSSEAAQVDFSNPEYVSGFDLVCEPNTGYELFLMWNGSKWIASYSDYAL